MIKSIAYIIICVVYVFSLVGCAHTHKPTPRQETMDDIIKDIKEYSRLSRRHSYIINKLEVLDTKIDDLCTEMALKKSTPKED